ncbi:MAG: hypothetical protein AAF337_09715, partial [Pseudomonadota bacterium]
MEDAPAKPNTFLLVALYPYRDLLEFSGRTARSTFWLHVVMAYLFGYALTIIVLPMLFDTTSFQEAAMMAENEP